MKALLKSQSFLPVDLLFCTTMAPEVPGDWTPLFPNSNTAPMRIGLTSRLELRDSGLFFIWKSSLLYSYSLHHLVPTGKVCIQMSGESNLRLVSFRNGHRAPFGTEPERILLWFSTRVHEPGRKAGRWFKVIEEHTDALRLSMGDLFHWEIVVDKQGESLLPEAHVIKCGDTFQSMSLMIDLGKPIHTVHSRQICLPNHRHRIVANFELVPHAGRVSFHSISNGSAATLLNL